MMAQINELLFSYLSKKFMEPVEGFFRFPGDFSFTLAMALLLESKVDDTVEPFGIDCLGFFIFFPFSILAANAVAQSILVDCAPLFLPSTESRFSLLHPSAKCTDLLTCKIFCFST